MYQRKRSRLSSVWEVIQVLVVMVFLLPNSQCSSQAEECVFDGTVYQLGDQWHPFLQPFGHMSCINCTCHQSGVVSCEGEKCPRPPCENPQQVEGKCCPLCTDNIPPDVQPWRESELRTCLHDGYVYQHSQVFPATTAALRPQTPHTCILCFCIDGRVICNVKGCEPIKCKDHEYPDDDCCPVCKDGSAAHALDGDLLGLVRASSARATTSERPPHPAPQDTHTEGDCRSGDRLYKNGSRWHPVIGPFGEMECVICTCKDGEMLCERVQCAQESGLPCRHPQNIPGECCKVCLPELRSSDTLISTLPNSVTPDRLPTEIDGATTLKACPAPSTDSLVLQAHSEKHYTLVFDGPAFKGVQVLTWKLRRGQITGYGSRTLPASRLKELFREGNKKYAVIGSLRSKRVSKFKTKMKSFMGRCERRKRGCSWNELLKKIKRLRLRKVEYQYEC